EAIHAAQVIAAMEAAAFGESDLQTLLDIGLSVIPEDSLVSRMIRDIRAWHRQEPDWRKTRELIARHYGYDRYGGNCHVIPNHALIILALLYGDDDFQKSLMIVNTCGWDTDCNSGNVGCLLGIKNGLRGLEGGPDWRGPLADRLYLPTADGGRAITDAVNETYHVARAGYALAGLPLTEPKGGARFHFSLPGSVQGFHLDQDGGQAMLANDGHPGASGERCLAIRYRQLSQDQPVSVTTPTFIPPEALTMPGYSLLASPTLYSGQTVTALLSADQHNEQPVTCRLFIRAYGAGNSLVTIWGPEYVLMAQQEQRCHWRIPDTAGEPIAEIGLMLSAERQSNGCVYLDSLTWEGAPDVTFERPQAGSDMWHRAWVNGVDQFKAKWINGLRTVQNYGRGLVSQGTREWTDYSVRAAVTPHMVEACGLAARVQGMRRYYALLITSDGWARLIKELDGERFLAQATIPWELDRAYDLKLCVEGNRIQAFVDEQPLFDLRDEDAPLLNGAVGLVCQEGRADCDAVSVQPLH
ncbi:MAG: ADP-ribosylglycohydrolase family protein, partial [Ktedonobacteraceae bacterium]|nr:ADP-ribosylglycohydrolase family protein [Ktedonobacteraceae bacterium]